MLTDAHNSNFYPDWLGYIKSEGTRDAFQYIVGLSACLKSYRCHPYLHGVYKDFRFIDFNDEQPFAFGLAQNWLLFYFRPPAIRSKRYSFEKIAESFETAAQTNNGEWTLKLKTIEDVQLLWKLLKII